MCCLCALFGVFHGRTNSINVSSPNLSAVSDEIDVSGPIGIFDSGFGGLTVARAVIDLLPNEDIVYIGDTGRYPYGDKDPVDVREYARELAWSLVRDYNAKAIVVACNTAAAALPVHELEAELAADGLHIPVIGSCHPIRNCWCDWHYRNNRFRCLRFGGVTSISWRSGEIGECGVSRIC